MTLRLFEPLDSTVFEVASALELSSYMWQLFPSFVYSQSDLGFCHLHPEDS